MAQKPTPQQQKVIDAPRKNTLVSAGAGCGKSTTLTTRIITRIKSGELSLRNIVVLSFTNASATDIRKKIKEALEEELKANPSSRLQDEYDYIDQALICTFDSLCHSLFLKYAYKLNIKSNINLVDNQMAVFILEEKLEKLISDKYLTDSRFMDIEKKYSIRDNDSILQGIIKFYTSKVRNMVDPAVFLDVLVKQTADSIPVIYDRVKTERTEAIKTIVDSLSFAFSDEVLEVLEPFIRPYRTSTLDELLDYIPSLEGFPPGNRKPLAGDSMKATREVVNKIKAALITLSTTPGLTNVAPLVNGYAEDAKLIAEILKELMKEYDEYSLANNFFTFNDIAKQVIRLFKENPDVLEEVKNDISEIYIDEYQDTSNVQEELISLISNNNVMAVGDIKQSIYRFRDANPDIFKSKFDEYGPKGDRIDMQNNFRSRAAVIKAINDMFDLLMVKDWGGIDYMADHHLIAGLADKPIPEGEPVAIEFHEVNKADSNGDDLRKAEKVMNVIEDVYNDILTKINNSKGALTYKDFVIITRNKSWYNDYMKRAQERNIPVIAESSKPFIRNIEIATLISIFKYIKDSHDKLSLLSILRSFLFDFTEQDIFDASMGVYNKEVKAVIDQLNEFRIKREYITVSQLLLEICEVFGFYQKLYKLPDSVGAEQRMLYISNLFNSFMNLGWDYNDICEYFEKLAKPSINELDISYSADQIAVDNAITIMTIHKSKGLEFPYVYFIETDSKIGKETKSFITSSRTLGMGFKEIYKCPYVSNLIFEENSLEQKLEDIRLLYVCLTRAKTGIVIFTEAPNASNSEPTKFKDALAVDEIKNFKTFDDLISGAYEYMHVTDITAQPNPPVETASSKTISGFGKLNVTPTAISNARLSHRSAEIITESDKYAMDYGTKLHEQFEYFDFFTRPFDSLEEPVKSKIEKFATGFLDNKDIVPDKIIAFYPEYEIPYKDTFGSIDLLIETESSFIVVDYKSKDITPSYYEDQVNGYKAEIKSRTTKNVSGYLYSLADGIYKKVD